jgi:tight adherence protein B
VSSTATSLVIFAAVTLGLLTVPLLLSSLFSSEVWRGRQRLKRESRKSLAASDGKAALFANPDQLTLEREPEAAGGRGTLVAPRSGFGAPLWLQEALEQAGIPLKARQLLVICGWLGLALGVVGTLFRGPLLGLGVAAAGAALPVLLVHWRRKARREKILQQLPSAFGLMARVLRAGHSVPQALMAVADTCAGPLAAEFSQCHKKQNLGIRPEITFNEMARRTGLLEVRLFVSAMLIQQQAGGNLSEVLERLATLVRERLRLRKQVRTLTAEGRLQGLTLLCLPVVIFAALMIINRKYAQVLLEHPSLLGVTAAMMGAGMLWIRKIVRYDY